MIDIFKKVPKISTGVNKPSNWSFVQEGIRENIETVKSYYTLNVRAVKSSHLLIRLLDSIAVPKTINLNRYYTNVDAMALNLSMVLKMTSSIYKGDMFSGVFYGGTTPEILIATDESFDIEAVNRNWQTVCAVKPLLHSKTDMLYQIPFGKRTSDENELAIILINIPMLAVQYRAFCLHELINNPLAPRGPTHFVAAYVLPNMLEPQTELVLFNRIYNRLLGLENNNDNRRRHPFSIRDYSSYLDKAIGDVVKYISKSSKSYRTIFHTLPSIYEEDLYSTLILPNIANTRQVDWVLTLSRLKMVIFLINAAGDELLAKNQKQMNQVLRALRLNNVLNSFEDMLPTSLYYSVEGQLDIILQAMGKNSFN